LTKRSARANGIIAVLGDRPVAYHPALAKVIGVKEAIFVCQLLYWDGRGRMPGGWIYKTQPDWTDETGLSRYEQETVRKHLIKNGLLEEKRRGVPARLYYRLRFDMLKAAILEAYPEDVQIAETPQSSLQDESDPERGDSADIDRGVATSQNAGLPPTISENTHRSPNENWQLALDELRLQMTGPTYDTWLQGSTATAEDGVYTIHVRDAYTVEWLTARWLTPIQRTLQGVTGEACQVVFEEG
jgi:hypothetical protein